MGAWGVGALFGEFGALGDEVWDRAQLGGAVRAPGNVGCVVGADGCFGRASSEYSQSGLVECT